MTRNKLSIVAFRSSFGSFNETLTSLENLGFDYIDMAAEAGIDPKEVKTVLASHKIRIGEISGLWGIGEWYHDLLSPDAAVRKSAQNYGKYTIDLASAFGQMTEFALITTREIMDENDKEKLRRVAISSIRELASYASDRGVTLLLEAVNRFEIRPGACLISKQAEAMEMIRAVDAPNLSLVFDTFHCAIEDTDIIDNIRKYHKAIKHFHLVDSNRSVPGTGNLDIKSILQALRSCGYRGAISFEPFPMPPLGTIQNSINYLNSIFPLLV